MPLSRLRLRLAASFALAFFGGLLLLSATLVFYTRRQSDRRLTRELRTEAAQLAGAVRLEFEEAPANGVEEAVRAALEEWPARPEAFGVYASDERRIAVTGPPALSRLLPEALAADDIRPVDLARGTPHVRLVPYEEHDPPFRVMVAGTATRLDAETEGMGLWLLASVPTTVVLGLIGGYLLSRYALKDVSRLEHAIGEIGPDALATRLPVNEPPDEVDRLASRFNALLQQLQESRAQNQRFLEQTAHQIRTPLTLVLGEADLALGQVSSPATRGEALRRIRLAATQMRRRVEELLLLARASSGQRAPRTDAVELDGLALECADLMRSRAQALGRKLELYRVDPLVLTASEPLLREAIIELLENACRHGSSVTPVRLSVSRDDDNAVIEVGNAIAGEVGWPMTPSSGKGLGLQVVGLIAHEHGGRLVHRTTQEGLTSALHIPLDAVPHHRLGLPR
jgi:signal transduction histidine kinase